MPKLLCGSFESIVECNEEADKSDYWPDCCTDYGGRPADGGDDYADKSFLELHLVRQGTAMLSSILYNSLNR